MTAYVDCLVISDSGVGPRSGKGDPGRRIDHEHPEGGDGRCRGDEQHVHVAPGGRWPRAGGGRQRWRSARRSGRVVSAISRPPRPVRTRSSCHCQVAVVPVVGGQWADWARRCWS